jgi:hypothetical protein
MERTNQAVWSNAATHRALAQIKSMSTSITGGEERKGYGGK